jgi:hypothetical protein
METAVLERPKSFELTLYGWEKKLNGERTDEKTFKFEGLVIETEIKGDARPWVSVKILQDGNLLFQQSGNDVRIAMKDEKIEVSYHCVSGSARGTNHLVRGWKVSADPRDESSYRRDDQV